MKPVSTEPDAASVPLICSSALDLIGNTPLVALRRIHPGPGALFAKVEFLQPGGSVKDRSAKWILEAARRSGKLMAGQPVVEMTSGNMGAGLAVVCAALGHPFTAVMSAGNSPERAKMIRAFGAQVVLVPQLDGLSGQVTGKDIAAAGERAGQIAHETGAYYVDQFNSPECIRAHEAATGPEIWSALGERLNAFVTIVGTGGTFIGAARFLKSRKPAIVCAAVEPAGSEVLAGRPVTKAQHLLQGAGYGRVTPQWDAKLADAFLAVSDEEAAQYRTLLVTKESLHAGFTAAANVCAAMRLITSGALGPEPTVVTILPDTGLKY